MTRVPRPTPGVDLKSLPLKPAEAFLLSRIDGLVDERELTFITGLAAEDVASVLKRLVDLGAVTFDSQRVQPQPTPIGHRPLTQPGSSVSTSGKPAPASNAAPITYGRTIDKTRSESPPLYDPAELDEPVEIEADRRRRILDLYYRLDELTYYELLGISELSDKKQIKSAYYLVAPDFHPDKFFRKNLGSFKGKIEAIFARFTLAHDVLTSKQKRPEYDAYLEQTHRNRAMVALLDQSQRDIAAVTSAVEESAKAILVGAGPSSNSVSSTPGRYVAPSDPPRAAESAQSRRDTFARKLSGGAFRPSSGAPPRPSAPPAVIASVPPSGPPVSARSGGEALKARYDAARAEAARLQIARYVDNAKSALERKDFASAANAYRIAASLAPNDAAVQTACAETAQLAAAALADGFLKQAEYEAHNGRWADAALSYAKVCNGRPEDARAHERVAFATIHSNGSSRRAVEFARRAVELLPKQADLHVTLARAYLAAGLDKSATGELDRALELAPGDARVKGLVQGLRDQPQKDGKVG